ncbi:polysaccharide deacetylase family protein [Gemmatimonas sp.]
MTQHQIKDRLVGLLAIGGVARVAATLSGPSVVIVMMHRFSGETGGFQGHDIKTLRRALNELRTARVSLVGVEAALGAFDQQGTWASTGSARPNAFPQFAFTIDDGYADAVEVAMPVFAEFDCPVTCFVAPHIVEAREWYWWDKVDYLLRNTSRTQLRLDVNERSMSLPLHSSENRSTAFETICSIIKSLPTESVPALLQQVAFQADTELPRLAPDSYRVLTWNEMRAVESAGWKFGAHTMTHPLLGRCSDEQAEWEITESLASLRRELRRPSEVFCYPVGRDGDFGVREYEILRRNGVEWALASTPGRLHDHARLAQDPAWKLRVPRFSFDDRPGGLVRTLLG